MTEDIQQSVDRIVSSFAVEKILLFGSHVRGTVDKGSDVDLLVIMGFEGSPVDAACAIRRVVQFPFPVDIIVRTSGQIEESVRNGDPFFREVMREGVALYEAAD